MNQANTPGDRIKAMRIERKLTQDRLATDAGISTGFLSDLENGKSNVGADKLLDIAEALDVSLDYLMKGEQEKGPSKDVPMALPASLVRLASREGLTINQIRQLMVMQRQVIAFRNDLKSINPESFDWEQLFGSLKNYIKNDFGPITRHRADRQRSWDLSAPASSAGDC